MCYSCDFLGEDIHKTMDTNLRFTLDHEDNHTSNSITFTSSGSSKSMSISSSASLSVPILGLATCY